MTKIAPIQFIDDFHRASEIKHLLAKDRYYNPFKFLDYHFNDKGANVITVRDLQAELCIPDRTKAYQILEGFCVLGLLIKKLIKNRTHYFKSTEWWDLAKKETEKNGSAGKNR